MKIHPSPALLPALATLLLLTLLASPRALAQNGKPDAEGFLRDWLVLAPFPLNEGTGGDEIDVKQFADEALPASAKAGATQAVLTKTLTWKKTAAPAFYLDFKTLYPERTENVVAWAVAYVTADTEMTGLTLRMNSNDQGKAYLNGEEIVKFTDTRTLEKSAEDATPGVTLKKGVNVVVLKVSNQENDWQGSLRFLDAAGKPVTALKVSTAP